MAAGKTTWFLRRALPLAVPLLILGAGVLGARALVASRPTVPRTTQEATPTLVEVMTVQARDEQAIISAFGTVQAHRELTVQPQVGGRVIAQHDNLISGGLLQQGDVLLHVDPRDYQFAVETERGALAKAEFELQVEQGNQVVARREWSLLESSIETSELGKLLALRKPHLQEKQAAVAAAKSRLAKAELDLKRTVLTAPFNALVLTESVEVGQLINAQSSVARLVYTDEFRVEVSIPIHQLPWVKEQNHQLPGSSQKSCCFHGPLLDEVSDPPQVKGSPVRILRNLGNGQTVEREGRVERLLGDLTENGRMARLLVLVHDPLGRERSSQDRLPLLLGEYVRVEIEGPVLPAVFVLPRSGLREGSRVWVKNTNNELEVREVEVSLSRKDSVLIGRGLNNEDQIIISPLPVALPGMLLQSAALTPAQSTPSPVAAANLNPE